MDLSSLFVMPDLGASGVVGGGRPEGLPLDREARVSGATSRAPAGTAAAGRHTVALSDGTRITFSDAVRLLESA